ncbi:MAG: hypothetical protein ACR2Q4_22525 [Geminicoccaceae bacterium]
MAYFRAHWLGQQTLAWSCTVNFLLPFLLVTGLAQLIRPPFIDHPAPFLMLAGAYLVLGCLMIYPWQLIGLMRACERDLRRFGDVAWVTAVQGLMIVSLVATAATLFSLLQTGIGLYAKSAASIVERNPGFTIEPMADRSLLKIHGPFEPGLTSALRRRLTEDTAIRGLVLSSNGGRIHEGRGIAKLIIERELDTLVFATCSSACILAYVAGTNRFLGDRGRLGFHQYRLTAQHPLIDVKVEQDKDRAFYRARGVDPAFLDKIFDASHETIWFPSVEQLLDANAVHRMIDSGVRQD